MGIFRRIFGSAKSLDGLVDAAKSGIDKLVYTGEEKAEAAERREERLLEQQRFHLDWMGTWLKTTSPQNVARRVLAFLWVGSFMLLLWVSVVFNVVAAFAGDPISWVDAAEHVRKTLAEDLSMETMLILTFYFAPHLGEKLVGMRTPK